MNALSLASLVSITLTCASPWAFAQGKVTKVEPYETVRLEPGIATKAEPVQPARLEPRNEISYRKHETAGIGEEDFRLAARGADILYALKLYLTTIDSGGFRLEVDPIDEAPAWIVVCLQTGEGAVPVGVLEARDPRQTVVDVPMDEFHGMPLSLFAVRISPDGHLEFSEAKRASRLVEEAWQRGN